MNKYDGLHLEYGRMLYRMPRTLAEAYGVRGGLDCAEIDTLKSEERAGLLKSLLLTAVMLAFWLIVLG